MCFAYACKTCEDDEYDSSRCAVCSDQEKSPVDGNCECDYGEGHDLGNKGECVGCTPENCANCYLKEYCT